MRAKLAHNATGTVTTSRHAKERLSISELWELLNLPDKPGRSCHSSLRDDGQASFLMIYYGCRKGKDHATDEGGDAIDFLARALSLSKHDASRRLIETAGVSLLSRTNERALGNFIRSHDAEEEEGRGGL